MVERKRMPPLKINEVILLVDAYFQMKVIMSFAVRSEILLDLSNKMPFTFLPGIV